MNKPFRINSTLGIMDLHKVCQTTVVADNTGGTYIMVSDVPISFGRCKKYNTPDNPKDGREGDLERRLGETLFSVHTCTIS